MKYIKSLFVLALVLLFGLPLYAQWNGIKEITIVREEDDSQTAKIGTPDSDEDICYEWFGPNVETDIDVHSDIHDPEIIVHPKKLENVYLVRRRHSCGVEEGQVIVRLQDSITLVSVTPNRECYNVGERYELDQFTFVTNPEGYESLVQLDGARDTAYVAPGETAADDELHFVLPYNGHRSEKTATVLVYNTNNIHHYQSSTSPTSPVFEQMKNTIEKIKGMINAAKAISDFIQGKIPPDVSPCQPIKDFSGFSLPIPDFFYACCNGDEGLGFHLTLPRLHAKLGIDCSFPLEGLAIPRVGGLFITLKVWVEAQIGQSDIYYRGGLSCVSGIVRVDFGVSIFGGVKIMALDDDVFHASLRIGVSARTGMDWYIGQELKFKPLDVDFKVEGEIVLFSLVEISASATILPLTFFDE